jgi:hypothetical protein
VDESKDNISRLIENMTTCLLTGIIVKEEVAPTERFQGKPDTPNAEIRSTQ